MENSEEVAQKSSESVGPKKKKSKMGWIIAIIVLAVLGMVAFDIVSNMLNHARATGAF